MKKHLTKSEKCNIIIEVFCAVKTHTLQVKDTLAV